MFGTKINHIYLSCEWVCSLYLIWCNKWTRKIMTENAFPLSPVKKNNVIAYDSQTNQKMESDYWTNDSYESVLLMNSSKDFDSVRRIIYWTESIRINQHQWTALKLSLFSVKQVLHQSQNCLYSFVFLKMNICWYSTAWLQFTVL